MAFTNGIDVATGDAILASTTDNLADNTEFNREKANVEHNFDISTGTGYHKAITQLITDVAGATVKDLILSEWDPVSGTPAAGQALAWVGKMSDSASNQDTFGRMELVAQVVTSAAESAEWRAKVLSAGAETTALTWGYRGIHSVRGALLESNMATPRHVESVTLFVSIIQDTGAVDKFQVSDAGANASGVSSLLTGGIHTNATAVTATKAATSAGDTDANKVFLDTDSNTIRIKKTSGSAINTRTYLVGTPASGSVDVSSVQYLSIASNDTDANFTGSPSSLQIQMINSSGSAIDPFSLVSSDGQAYYLTISGFIIL